MTFLMVFFPIRLILLSIFCPRFFCKLNVVYTDLLATATHHIYSRTVRPNTSFFSHTAYTALMNTVIYNLSKMF